MAKVVTGVKNGRRYYNNLLTQIEITKLIDSLNQSVSDFTTAEGETVPPYIESKDRKLFDMPNDFFRKTVFRSESRTFGH